jgi:uncharacterized protein RhaS with RHS repeats
MFDPSIGRWLEEDPSGFEAGDVNLYRYVENDPTNATDPTGLAPIKFKDFEASAFGKPLGTNEYGDFYFHQDETY